MTPPTCPSMAIPMPDDTMISDAIRVLAAERGRDKTFCPSEVARRIANDERVWRSLMPRVRAIGRGLAEGGHIRITQRGAVLDPSETPRGPIRFGMN